MQEMFQVKEVKEVQREAGWIKREGAPGHSLAIIGDPDQPAWVRRKS